MTSNHTHRRRLVAGLALVLVAVLSGCAETAADQAAVHYNGGPLEGASFNRVISPGSGQTFLGPEDDAYHYPTTTRDFTASNRSEDGPETSAISCPVDGVNTEWTVVVYFRINTQKLRGFHENVGMKYKAWDAHETDAKGWTDMLRKQFEPHLVNAVQRVCRAQKLDSIQKDAEVFGKLNNLVGADLKRQVNEGMSGEYLCGPGFHGPVEENGTGAECPEFQVAVKGVWITDERVRKSFDDQRTAVNRQATVATEGDSKIIENRKAREAGEELARLYANPGYVDGVEAQAMVECARNAAANCTLVITPGGGGVNVNAGR
jgi:hypothetical protein